MSQKAIKAASSTVDRSTFDRRDRLILALWAQLRAERETRAALEATIRDGGLSKEVLIAMASDPVPVITSEDIAEVERFDALNSRQEDDHSVL